MFAGFFPEKRGERQRLCGELAALQATLLFFESPHRIVESLRVMAELLPGREFAVGRELTKRHEEVLRGSPEEIADLLGQRPSVKGEITIVIGPPAETQPAIEDAEAAMREALATSPISKAAAEISRRFNLPRKAVYARMLAMKE
jgi:16S rRNA (cytidine1402-2'-O)-methyltransferase